MKELVRLAKLDLILKAYFAVGGTVVASVWLVTR